MFIWGKMKKISLLSTLLLTSSMLYAGWIRYEFDSTTGVYTSVPEYSCLEMMCEHDCVENTETGEGECCPALVEGRNCVSDTRNEKGCILSLKKTCPPNQYCNKSTQTCQLIPSCNPCQKFDKGKGQCVTDTSKNNQAVGACGKCNNGSVITDTTKVNPCKTCNTSNWTLTNKTNGTQAQDVCHICQNGNVVLKDSAKQFISNNTCVECLTDYGTGESGACTTTQKPLCKNNTCQECPAEKPYWENGACHSEEYENKLPKSVSFSIHNGGDKHTSCKSKHKVYVYVEALSTNKGTFTGTLSLVETDSDDHRKYLRLNGEKFKKDTQYDYDVSLEPGDKQLVATYSDSDNFAKSSSRGKITITKADLSGKFSGGAGEVKVQIEHSPSCSLSWVSDNENGFGPNGGTYSY
jgi:hypothetical protein